MKKKILIEGMMCNHCVGHVKNALEALEGVSSVEVNLDGKYAVVETDAADSILKEAVEEEGYTVTAINND